MKCQLFQRAQIAYLANFLTKTYGTNWKTNKMKKVTHSSKRYFRGAKMLTQKSASTRVTLALTLNFSHFIKRWLSLIMSLSLNRSRFLKKTGTGRASQKEMWKFRKSFKRWFRAHAFECLATWPAFRSFPASQNNNASRLKLWSLWLFNICQATSKAPTTRYRA